MSAAARCRAVVSDAEVTPRRSISCLHGQAAEGCSSARSGTERRSHSRAGGKKHLYIGVGLVVFPVGMRPAVILVMIQHDSALCAMIVDNVDRKLMLIGNYGYLQS